MEDALHAVQAAEWSGLLYSVHRGWVGRKAILGVPGQLTFEHQQLKEMPHERFH